MADDVTTFVVAARDNATATINKVSRELKTMGGTASGAVSPLNRLSTATGGLVNPFTLAIGAAAGLAAMAGDFTRKAAEEEKGIALLNESLKTNAKDYTGNSDAVEKVIAAREKLAFDDDAQRKSLGALVAVTHDSSKALTIQRTAMDLARLKGMDLETATTLLGKVYGGNTAILKRYGIVIDKNATSTEAIAAIQKIAAGQAEAYAQTSAGSAEAAGIAFQDLQENIGKKLLPVMKSLAQFAVNDLIPALESIVTGAGRVADAIGSVTEVAGNFFNNFAQDFGTNTAVIHKLADETGKSFDQIKATVLKDMNDNNVTFEQATSNVQLSFDRLKSSAFTTYAAVAEAANKGFHQAISYSLLNADILAAILPTKLANQYVNIRSKAYGSMVAYAQGLIDAQDKPKVAMDALVKIQGEALDRGTQIARLKGQLNSAQLAAGLDDKRPAVHAAAVAARQAIIDQLESLGYSAKIYGLNIASGLSSGMDAGYYQVLGSARALGGAVKGTLGIYSEPTDHRSPMYGITKWGGNYAKTIARGMVGDLGALTSAARQAASAAVPDFGAIAGPSASMAYAGAGGYGGGANVTINFQSTFPVTPAQGAEIARAILPELTREQRRQGLS